MEHWLEYAIKIVVVFLLVLANGFFVASEFSLVGVRKSRIETLAKAGNKSAKRVQQVLPIRNAYISATQLGITLASLALGWIGEDTVAHMLEPVFDSLVSATAAAALAHTAAIAIAFTIITYMHIVVGELVPKTLALERSEAVSFLTVWPMQMFLKVFKAPIWVLNKSGTVIIRALGLHPTHDHSTMYTEEELLQLVDLSHKGGHLDAGERELIHNIFEFASETVRDCMVPRPQIIAVPADSTVESAAEVFVTTDLSRIPVFDVAPDSVIGVLHGKDILEALHRQQRPTARELMRPTIFVPSNAQLDYVLGRMKRTGHHMALVVDEHGTLEGLITLEDILEEIVGEIRDEFDEHEEGPIVEKPDGSLLLDAAISVRALNRQLGLQVPESSHYTTLAGFLLTEVGTIPKPGTSVTYEGTRFIVEKVNRNSIRSVRLFRKQEPQVALDEPSRR
jgi:putative hemolysin